MNGFSQFPQSPTHLLLNFMSEAENLCREWFGKTSCLFSPFFAPAWLLNTKGITTESYKKASQKVMASWFSWIWSFWKRQCGRVNWVKLSLAHIKSSDFFYHRAIMGVGRPGSEQVLWWSHKNQIERKFMTWFWSTCNVQVSPCRQDPSARRLLHTRLGDLLYHNYYYHYLFYYHYRDGFPLIIINWWWSFLTSLLLWWLSFYIRSRLQDDNLPSYHHCLF